ncbi:hypothetical protein FRC01_010372 [Tulasnella sp. 417]|nr:hypothetical protein FRC01_010372 [Tulasnella sp. 417]
MDFPPQPRRPKPALALSDQHQHLPVASTSDPTPPHPTLPGHLSPPSSARDDEDDINREFERLENLRLNVKQNLTLRPLKSSPGPTSSSAGGGPGTLSLNSASSANLDSHPPTAIRRTFKGLPLNLKSDSLASNGLTDSSGDTASTGTMSTPQSPSEEGSPILYTAISPSSASHINALPLPPSLHSPSDIISHYADPDESPASPFRHDASPLSPSAALAASSSSANAQPISTSSLLAQLQAAAQPHVKPRPLLLDTRPTGNFQEERLKGSINLAIPTLILKRWKKYLEKDSRSGHLALVQAIGDSVQGLQGFVTTEEGKEEWDRLLGTAESDASAPGLWNGDVVVYDEDMDEADPLGPTVQAQSKSPSPGPQQLLPPSSTPTTSWLLISILSSLTSSTPPSKSPNQVYWLRGGFAAARRDPSLRARHMISGETNVAEADDVKRDILPHRGGAKMDKEPAVYTSSPTEMDAPPLPVPPQNPPPSSLLSIPSSSIQSPTSPSSSSLRQRAVSTSAIPSPSTSSNSGMFQGGGAPGSTGTSTTTTSGFKGRGLLTLKTDLKIPRSKSKQRTQIDVGPVAEESTTGDSVDGGGVRASSLGGTSSTSHGSAVGVSDLTPPSRNTSNDSHTPTVPSHSPLPPLRKASPIGRITGSGSGGPSYSYSSMYSEASPSPSPSTITAHLPFPRTPTTSGSGNGGTASSSSSSPGGGFLRNRSYTAMLPKLDTKTSRERLAPINTNLASTSNTKIVQPPPPIPPLPSTSENNTTASSSNNNTNNTNTTPPADQQQQQTQQQPGMPPKLSLRTTPLKAATLAAPIASPKVSGFGLKLNLPPSPNRAAFSNNVTSPTQDFKSPLSGTSMYFSPVQTPSEMTKQYPFTPVESTYHSNTNFQYASFALLPDPPRTPGLGVPSQHYQQQQQPSSPTTPLTARPPPSPAMSSALTSESEGAIPPFIISTIVPGFLYLGPEMSTEENVEELMGFGVKRILNMAIECEPDDYGLDLDKRFEKYHRIGMRDTVEEDRMSKALKEVCELLDDARLHNAPTYVHCKAGKSRSVTAVMAYLIHANHWTLGQAYKYVVDRRKGVSPNIGFVSELMNFEEQKLGTKSIGVTPDLASADVVPPPSIVPARVRAAHARDSLPPGALFHTQSVGEAMSQIGVPVTAGSLGGAAVGAGAGEEMEVKDEEGRYRHARRAPKSEATLQPMRRVSKAGLESSWV